jgi:predicted nucleic acid-binding protein
VSVKVVADSSFLIALATIDALPLLSRIFSELFIPEAVYDEVVTQGAGLPGAEEVASAAWIKQTRVEDADKVRAYRAERLGEGEAEALALAEELNAGLVLVDDEQAWETAQRKGIACLRSVELLLEAHRRQLLDAEAVRVKLVDLGKKRWLNEEVLEVALRQLKSQ